MRNNRTDSSVDIGIVVIGRNEGERLTACLASVAGQGRPIVYVDSGSTDGSPDNARSFGAEVVDLDLSIPFTAARARNAGFQRLIEIAPTLQFVQFVDGDCVIFPGWIDAASRFFHAETGVGIAAGRLIERHPERSVYNFLCNLEWRGPTGEIASTGGIFIVRRSAFEAVGGFNADIIAAEDDEFCGRIRSAGWKIHRLDFDMALHDAAILKFSQWWTRCRRTGNAYAQVNGPNVQHFNGKALRSLAWGAALPAASILLSLRALPWLLLMPVLNLVSMFRIYTNKRKSGWSSQEARIYAFYVQLAKIPEAIGVLEFRLRALLQSGHRIIEYK